jgi:hypothetical protein
MPRRRVARPGTGSVARDAEPVYTWAFASSQPRGGQIIQYETRLEENGLIRCNCPGWIFSKGEPAAKTCKHKKMIEGEAPDILRRARRGETFDIIGQEIPVASRSRSSAATPEATPTNTRARFGRVIEI